MTRDNTVDALGIGLDEVPQEILKALLAAADSILMESVSPEPRPAFASTSV